MPLINRFTTTANGAMTFTGNTLGLSKQTNQLAIGTNDSIGAFSTLNLGSVVDAFPPGTTTAWQNNESAAILNLPSGSTVLYAELIWGGDYLSGSSNVSTHLNDPIILKTPLGSNNVNPDPATANTNTTPNFYMRSAIVTSLIQAAGGGTYSAAGIPAELDASNDTDNHAGWTLAVIYSNPLLAARNMTLFVGFDVISASGAPVNFTVSGFSTPASGPINGRILVSAQEGDANRTGDQMLFGPSTASLSALSGPNNLANNFFGSQINNDSGNLNTTGTFGTRNQNPATASNIPGGRQGWDITNVDGSAQLTNSQTSAVVRLTTNGDQYAVNALGVQVDVNAPSLHPVKTVDKAYAVIGDTLTYTVSIPNTSAVQADNVIFTDAIPANTSYVPGSFTLNGSPVIGANPSAGVNIGSIAGGSTSIVTFQVTVSALPTPSPIIPNHASMAYQYRSVPGGPLFNGSAITNSVTTQIVLAKVDTVKSVDKSFATLGDILTYTVVLTNSGNTPAINVQFKDTPTVNGQFVTGSVTVDGVPIASVDPTVGFSLGTIPVGGSVTVVFKALVVTVNAPTIVLNQSNSTFNYKVDPAGATLTGTSESNPVVTALAFSQVDTVKSVDKAYADIGQTLNYSIVTTNSGTVNATNVQFKDIPPTGTSFVTGSVTIGGVPSPSADPSTGFSLGTINPGNSVIVAFHVTVNSLPTPNPISNVATETFTYRINPAGPDLPGTSTSNPATTQINRAHVAMVKTVDHAFATIGEVLTYSIVLTNSGNVAATGITFQDAIPAGTIFVANSVTVGGIPQPGADPAVGFSIPDIPASGGTVTVTFQVMVNNIAVPALITNISSSTYHYLVDPAQPAVTATAHSNQVETQVDAALASIVKSSDKVFVVVGDTITYTSIINNAGSVPLTNVNFTDTLPTGTTFVAGSVVVGGVPQPTFDPSVGFLATASLAAGSSLSVVFQVTATAIPVPPQYDNTSSIAFQYRINPSLPPVSGSATSNTDTIPVAGTYLSVVKSVDKAYATIGDDLTYTAVLTNVSAVPLTGVSFHDTPPANSTFNAGSVTVGGLPDPGDPTSVGGVVIPNIAVGGSVTVTFTAHINSLPSPQPMSNTANVNFTAGGSPQTVTSNPANTQVNVGGLTIVKSSNKSVVTIGDTITYSSIVSNTGNVPIINAIFSDAIPSATSFVTDGVIVGGVPQPGLDPTTGFSIGNLTAGTSLTVSFQVTVNAIPSPNPMPNISHVAGNYKVDPAGPDIPISANSPSVSVQVNTAGLSLLKSVDKTYATINDNLTYTTTVTNTGNVAANNISFTDTPPLGTTFNTGSVIVGITSQPTFDPTTGFSIGNLAPGASITVVFTAKVVSQPTPKQIFNTSAAAFFYQIDPAGPVLTGDTTSNPALTIINTVSATLTKTVDKAYATVGDVLTYTVTLLNTGTVNLSNVVFTDVPPTGTSFNPGSVTINGVAVPLADPTTGIHFTFTMPGVPHIIAFTATVTSVPVPNPITNTAQIAYQYQLDPSVPPVSATLTSNPANTQINLGQITMAKSVDKTYVAVNDFLTYTVVVTNTGNVTANSVFFTDTPPSVTSFVSGSVIVGGTPQPTYDPIAGFSLGNLAPGATETVTFQVKVNALPPTPQIANTANASFIFKIDPNGTDVSGSAVSNPAFSTIQLLQVDLYKEVDKAIATTGDILTYTIDVDNDGTMSITNVVLTDVILSGTVFVPGSVIIDGVPQPLADPAAGITLGTIAPFADSFVIFQVQVVSSSLSVINNQARVDFNYRINPAGPVLTSASLSNIATTILVFTAYKQLSVQENLTLPDVKPDIEQILNVTVEIATGTTKVIITPVSTSAEGQILTGFKLIVEGRLNEKIEYVACDKVQSVHAAEFSVPFSTFIILQDNYIMGTPVSIEPIIEDVYTKALDKRSIFKNVTFTLKVVYHL